MTEHTEAMKLLQKHFDIALETPGGIKKLRELILTLAMQGKLVKQYPQDQPAAELLKEIETEKKRLVKAGKIRKQEPLPPIKKDEMPYAVPKGWEWVRLGNLGETNIGLTYSPSDIADNGTLVLRSSNIQNGKLDFADTVRVNGEIKVSSFVQEGDLLICARNGSKALVGKTALITGINEKMAFGAFMAVFRSRVNFYLLRFINSPLFRKMIDEVNTMTINQITQNNLKTTIAPLPPLAEQKRIVAKIEQLMALCDKLETERHTRDQKRLAVHAAAVNRLLAAADQPDFDKSWQFIAGHFNELYAVPANVAELKKVILQLAVMGKLVPQDPKDQPASELLKEIEAEKKRLVKAGKIRKQEPLPPIKPEDIPYAVPSGWQWVRLSEICKIIGGVTKGRDLKGEATISLPYLRVANVQDGYLNLKEIKTIEVLPSDLDKYRLVYGDILYTEGGDKDKLGRGTIWKNEIENCIHQNHIFRARPISKKIYSKFIAYYSQARMAKDYFFKHGKQTTNLASINLTILSKFPLPLPSFAEQKRIVARIDQLMALCDTLDKQIASATGKQTAILNAVLAKV